MKKIKIYLYLLLYSFSFGASIGHAAEVEAMQMPAWIVYSDGQKKPLQPGMEIRSGDQVKTGKLSRLLIRLSEGSQVKLGENARLDFGALRPAKSSLSIYEAFIKVAEGAFRFTTTAFGQTKKRNVEVKIGTITIGIRGTDIWGKSNSKEDLVALLEGNVSVHRAGEPEFTMQDPLSYYRVPKNKSARPVQVIPENKLAQWAAETEVLPGGGVLSVGGHWAVNLISLNKLTSAKSIQVNLSIAGYATEIQKIKIKQRDWYRLRVLGFKTREDARTFADIIDGSYGIQRPWIARF